MEEECVYKVCGYVGCVIQELEVMVPVLSTPPRQLTLSGLP